MRMKNLEYKIAKGLLDIEAVKLSPEKPFLWASGLHSPIYCDNRKALSYPGFRRTICESMIEIINADFKKVDVIAGVATGAIAYGAIVAEMMGKPFVYIRSKANRSECGFLRHQAAGQFQLTAADFPDAAGTVYSTAYTLPRS